MLACGLWGKLPLLLGSSFWWSVLWRFLSFCQNDQLFLEGFGVNSRTKPLLLGVSDCPFLSWTSSGPSGIRQHVTGTSSLTCCSFCLINVSLVSGSFLIGCTSVWCQTIFQSFGFLLSHFKCFGILLWLEVLASIGFWNQTIKDWSCF